MDIRRFGIGHRRPDGPPGTKGVRGGPIHTDERGVVAELALERGGSISLHSNPNLTYFLVIEGGGFVRVGDETARVSAGDAVVWPPDVVHAAWAELTPMRVIVVEFTGADVIEPRLLGTGVEGPGAGEPHRASDATPSESEAFGTPIARDGEPW
jgi:quercetin dioxygenase-like cupin family protein